MKNLLLFGGQILIFGFLLTSTINSPAIVVPLDIQNNISFNSTIGQNAKNFKLIPSAQLELREPTVNVKLLSPEALLIFDPLYCIYFITICIVGYIGSAGFSTQKPFTERTLNTLYGLIIITGLFFLLNMARYYWFNNYVASISNGVYGYRKSVFELPEFWILMLLFRVVPFFRKGVEFQVQRLNDQQLLESWKLSKS